MVTTQKGFIEKIDPNIVLAIFIKTQSKGKKHQYFLPFFSKKY